MYEYAAKILSVHDGDTCTALVDLGFRISQEMPLRLLGIDAPELSQKPAGQDARDHLRALIDGKQVTVRTEKDRTEKYGRYLATIFVGGDTMSVNDKMIRDGHARTYDGGKR